MWGRGLQFSPVLGTGSCGINPALPKPIFHFCEAVRLCQSGVSLFKVVVILLSVVSRVSPGGDAAHHRGDEVETQTLTCVVVLSNDPLLKEIVPHADFA